MSDCKIKRIWQVGPHQSARGGISTVISLLVEEQKTEQKIIVNHLPTACSGGRFAKFVMMLKALFSLFVAGLLGKVDLLHVHTSSGISLKRKSIFMKLGRFLGIPSLLHIHGSNFDQWYEDAPDETQSWIRNQLDQSVGVIALSESWRDFLLPITTTPIHVVYNSVPLSSFIWPRPIRKKGPLRLLFLGLLGERKGIFDLLEAMQQVVLSSEGISLELKIGGDGEVEKTLKMIEQLGLENSVDYLGWVDMKEKVKLLSETDVFVLPSYHEGLPMAILEAMAAGAAILTTPINGIPEAVHHDKNGFFVDPGDIAGLAGALKQLASNVENTEKLGAIGHIDAQNRFNISRAVNQLSSIYFSN